MTDWTTIVVAGITAAAAIGAALVTQRGQARSAESREDAARRERQHDDLAEALAHLYSMALAVESMTNAALALGRPADPDVSTANEFHAAEARARLLLPESTWREVDPYLRAVSIRVNAMSRASRPSARAEAAQLAEQQGIHTEDGLWALEQRFLAAARARLDELG